MHPSPSRLRSVPLAALLAGAVLLWTPAPVRAAPDPDAARLTVFKAAFIYHFLDYVQWPDSLDDGPLRIGIVGDSPLEAPLRAVAQKRRAAGRSLEVEVFAAAADIEPCHLLFIPPTHSDSLASILRSLADRPVLTVGNEPGLADSGVAINLVERDGRLKFEVNRRALAASGLQAGAELLKLAILVDDPG